MLIKRYEFKPMKNYFFLISWSLSSLSALAAHCGFERYKWEMNKNDSAQLTTLQQCEEKAARAQALLDAQKAKPDARIGMTAKQVTDGTRWGIPDSINRTEDASGVREQWVYGRDYFYFKNGRLTAIQTAR